MPRLHGFPCNKGQDMDTCLYPSARVTPYGVILSPRDQDTTPWSPSLTVPSSHGNRSRDIAGTAFPASKYSELTADGWNGPTDPCNTLFTRGGNTHTHYEPTAPRMRHDTLQMTQQTEQTHHVYPPRLNLSSSSPILRHTQMQTHDFIHESRAQNHPAFCRPPRYVSGGIYAPAYNGVPSTLIPSAPQSRAAATPVTVSLRATCIDSHTRHCRPQPRRSTQTPHLHRGTRQWQWVAL